MKPRLIASREQLLQVVRDRRDELDLSHETLDAIAGVQGGYSGKLLCDPPMRGFGEMSLKAVLDALALRIAVVVIVEDEDMAKRVGARWRPRRRQPSKKSQKRCVVSGPQIILDAAQHCMEDIINVEHENDRQPDQAKS